MPTMDVVAEDSPLTSLPWSGGPTAGSGTGSTPEVSEQVELPAAPAAAAAADSEQLPESIILYTVQPGDHLWSIAEQEVTLRSGGAASDGVTDADVARYWSTLIDANRDRLVDPDNTDLILPGQVLVLPF